MNCKAFQNDLPDLVLSPAVKMSPASRDHLAGCAPCKEEYESLSKSIAMMDLWQAPEPSPYFDQKLAVLLREEQAAPHLGFVARLREYVLLSTGRQFRSAVAGALVLGAILGGGGYAGFQHHGDSGRVSATVNDLQILDKNAQALQEMDQLLQDDDTSDDPAAHEPS